MIDKTGFRKKKELFSDIVDRNKDFMEWKKAEHLLELQKKKDVDSLNMQTFPEKKVITTRHIDFAKKKKLLPPYYTLMTTYKGGHNNYKGGMRGHENHNNNNSGSINNKMYKSEISSTINSFKKKLPQLKLNYMMSDVIVKRSTS